MTSSRCGSSTACFLRPSFQIATLHRKCGRPLREGDRLGAARPSSPVRRSSTVGCRLGSWDPVISAGYLSAFAGVLAGLVIAAIVVLLSDRNPNPERVRAVTLL